LKFDQEEDKPTVLGIGIGLVVIGLVFIIVTNVINDRERKRILLYLVRA
jgi:hypothetical protein